MDDDHWGGGKTAHNYVRSALADLAAGRPVREAETRPYGCHLDYGPTEQSQPQRLSGGADSRDR